MSYKRFRRDSFNYLKIIQLLSIITFLTTASFQILHKTDSEEVILKDNKTKSLQHFQEVLKVLRHPRCVNCHPSDDFPRQGDDHHKHEMGVERGADNKGIIGLQCIACHQNTNNQYSNIPGVPSKEDSNLSGWQLAPKSMGWLGRTDAEIGASLLDKNKNGGRSLKDLLEHLEHDPLVLWGWSPGGDRKPVSISHEKFIQSVKDWIETGAYVPEQGQ